MSQEIGIDSATMIAGDAFGGVDTLFSDVDTQQLTDFWSKVQFGETLAPDEIERIVDVFVKGVENPTTRPDAIGSLMSPQCTGILEDVFEQSWIPEIDADLKGELIRIAAEPNETARVQEMGQLTISELQNGQSVNDLPDPLDSDLPSPRSEADPPKTGAAGVTARAKEVAGDGPDPKNSDPPSSTFDKINEAYQADDMPTVKTILADIADPQQVLHDAGSESWALLIDLADDPDFRGMALDLLHDQGSDIIPILEEFTYEHSPARAVIEWIQTGEKPDIIDTMDQISDIVANNDMDSFKALFEEGSDRKSLIHAITTQGDEVSPMLVEMLGDSDRRVQVFAMDALHELGEDAVDDLRRTKVVNPDPAVRAKAELLLDAYFSPDETMPEVIQHWDSNNPFSANPMTGASTGGFGGEYSSFSLDIDYFTEKLSSPEDCMEALSVLVQFGQQAMPTLCQIVVNTQRRKVHEHS